MKKADKILSQLKKFYANESAGIGHYEDDLVELGWDLAEVLETEGSDSNIWKGNEEDFNQMIQDLRSEHSVVVIDTAVNHMHQGLLDALDRSGSDSENMMYHYEGDIVEYLINR